MRRTLICTIALTVLAPATALGGTPEAAEITDPAGDAGVEGTAVPVGGEDVDIVAGWFTTNETGTWAYLELVSFDVHPEDVVFSVDATLSEDRWLGVGYGSYVLPFPPFRTQGFQGCTGQGDRQPNCTTLPGEMLEDREGFAVRIPSAWIDGEDRLWEPTATVAAYTMWPAVTFDEAGPGDPYPLDTNGTSDEPLATAGNDAPEPAPSEADRSIPGPSLGALVTALAAGASVMLAADRRAR